MRDETMIGCGAVIYSSSNSKRVRATAAPRQQRCRWYAPHAHTAPDLPASNTECYCIHMLRYASQCEAIVSTQNKVAKRTISLDNWLSLSARIRNAFLILV